MRILVTGPRDWDNWRLMATGLSQAAGITHPAEITLIHGDAGGFDRMSGIEAAIRGWAVEVDPVPTWYPDGKYDAYAGHARNQRMVDKGADACVAGIMECVKPGCKTPKPHPTHGTADCISRVLLAGIPLIPVRYEREAGVA